MAKEEVDKIILDNLIFFSFVLFCSATKMTRKFWRKTKLVREKYEFAFNRKSRRILKLKIMRVEFEAVSKLLIEYNLMSLTF